MKNIPQILTELGINSNSSYEQILEKLTLVTLEETNNIKTISVKPLANVVRDKALELKDRLVNTIIDDEKGNTAIINKRIALIKALIGELDALISIQNTKNNEQDTTLISHNTRLERIEAITELLATAVSNHNSDIARLTALETDNTSNKSRLDDLEESVSGVESDVENLKTDNTSNKDRLDSLEADNTSNKGRLTDLETDNTTNKADIVDLKNDVEDRVKIADVVDGLTSSSTTKPLSAKQGKELKTLIDNILALLASNDTDLDTLQEIVSYIKSNKSLIEQITINKVNVSDIVDSLTSEATNQPLSAKQGYVLKGLLDAIPDSYYNKTQVYNKAEIDANFGYLEITMQHSNYYDITESEYQETLKKYCIIRLYLTYTDNNEQEITSYRGDYFKAGFSAIGSGETLNNAKCQFINFDIAIGSDYLDVHYLEVGEHVINNETFKHLVHRSITIPRIEYVQPKLVSGQNIKTLSGNSILGSGDINVKGDKGDKGDTGAVYTPSVSQAGIISWTNNGNLENPSPVNIKGERGYGLQFVWDGTRLGVKTENDTNYTYVDLKGDTGATGETGAAGNDAYYDANNKLNADYVDDANSTHKFVTSSEKAAWDSKQSKIDSTHQLSSDLVNDANQSHKFVTSQEKETWNNKQSAINSTHKLSAAYVDDGSSKNSFIKTITTQYVRITDLDTGVYKLKYTSSNNNSVGVYLYYNGSTNTSSSLFVGVEETILIVIKDCASYQNYTTRWRWQCLIQGDNYWGTTTATSGSYGKIPITDKITGLYGYIDRLSAGNIFSVWENDTSRYFVPTTEFSPTITTDYGAYGIRLVNDVDIKLKFPFTKPNGTYTFATTDDIAIKDEKADFVEDEYDKTLQIWNEKWFNGYWDEGSSGVRVIASSGFASSDYIKVKPSTTYTFTSGSGGTFFILYYTSSKSYISYIQFSSSQTFTTPSNCEYITFYSYNSYGTTYQNNIMLNEGSTAMSYRSYGGGAVVHQKDITLVLLWENGSPNSSYSGNMTTLDMSKYENIIVAYKVEKTSSQIIYKKVKYNVDTTDHGSFYLSEIMTVSGQGGQYRMVTRALIITSPTTIDVGSGRIINNGSTYTSDDYAIPIAVYGSCI